MRSTTAQRAGSWGWWLLVGLGACVSRDFADGQFLCDPQATDPCPPGLTCVDDLCQRLPGGGTGGAGGAAGGSGGQGGGGQAGQGGVAGGGGQGGGGSVPTPPSCLGLAANCGPQQTTDCCASALVPGGTFNRSNDPGYPATLSTFVLDRFEVTVGRYRTFVEAGQGTAANPPAPGDGAHPLIADSGWRAVWNGDLPANGGDLVAALQCSSESTWTTNPGGQETLPVNCVSWFMAFAFCAWDEGRLPTEAEWNYAAAGGDEQRVYPWGSGVDPSYASYDCLGDGVAGCALTDIWAVGSRPIGDGKWGHSELSGNMWERTLDGYVSPYPTPCTDCASVTAGTERVYRGGGYHSTATSSLQSGTRFSQAPSGRSVDVGFRCARAAP